MEATPHDDGDIDWSRKKKKARRVKAGDDSSLDKEPDHAYDALLRRLYAQLADNRHTAPAAPKKRTLPPPQLFRDGGKKMVWANFTDTCAALHRDPSHVMAYYCAELGTTASLDGRGRMVIRGRFIAEQVQRILVAYVNHCVACHACKGLDTHLARRDAITFVECASCQCARGLTQTQRGYVAQVGRRKRT